MIVRYIKEISSKCFGAVLKCVCCEALSEVSVWSGWSIHYLKSNHKTLFTFFTCWQSYSRVDEGTTLWVGSHSQAKVMHPARSFPSAVTVTLAVEDGLGHPYSCPLSARLNFGARAEPSRCVTFLHYGTLCLKWTQNGSWRLRWAAHSGLTGPGNNLKCLAQAL